MLEKDVLEKLEELKFGKTVLPLLNELAKIHEHYLLISPNKYQPESRLDKPFGVTYKINIEIHQEVDNRLSEELPSNYNHYEVDSDDGMIHIAVVRPTDKYELIRIMGTNSEQKHDLDTGTLLARLRRWEEEYGLHLKGAGVDWIKMKVERIPGELRDFVKEILSFAPETKHEINELEDRIKSNQPIVISW